jgi:hemolysin activation/secretion protein
MSSAQTIPAPDFIPGSADAGRVRPTDEYAPTFGHDEAVVVPKRGPAANVPDAAKGIHFVLRAVDIEGTTTFKPEALQDIYAAYLGREVTLDIAWMIAGAVTERYRARAISCHARMCRSKRYSMAG